MRIAILSDIHANLAALEACLAALEGLNIGRLAFLGDFVGYGPEPEAVVSRVAPLVASGAIAVMGNHDKAVLRDTRDMNPVAAQAISWTRDRLSEESKAWLAALPLEVRSDDILFVHAEASDPAAWHYVTDREAARASLASCQAQATFCGHVHVPALYCLSSAGKMTSHIPAPGVAIPLLAQRRWLAVMGAVGQPRDGNPAAFFAVFDTATRALTCHRAPYDAQGVAQKIRDSNLPEWLADRLVRGR